MVISAVHAASASQNCLVRNEWICPLYVQTRYEPLVAALGEHVFLTVCSVLLGAAIALPLAILAHRVRRARGLTLGVTTVLYTIPSIALFFLIVPMLGLQPATAIAGLTLYSLTILVRNLLVGLDGIDPEVLDAATGMGLGRGRMLWTVELPLALPSALAGLRVAAVSTVALATVGAVVNAGGLGEVIVRGLRANFNAEVLTASVLCVLLAIVIDVVLLGAQRAVTPWRRTA